MTSYKAEVIADRSGKWVGNQLRFATADEAEHYVRDLMMRWTLVTDTRVVPSDDPVTDRWVDGKVERVAGEADCHVVDEEARPVRILASYTTVKACEDHIARLQQTEPDKVHRGGFGIDAPEHKINPPGRVT